jgi:hypothetical protein
MIAKRTEKERSGEEQSKVGRKGVRQRAEKGGRDKTKVRRGGRASQGRERAKRHKQEERGTSKKKEAQKKERRAQGNGRQGASTPSGPSTVLLLRGGMPRGRHQTTWIPALTWITTLRFSSDHF